MPAYLPAFALTPGHLVASRYRLLEPLGEGGVGVVWAATDEVTGQERALKFLRLAADERSRRRFEREAELLKAMDHPGIVRMHDAFEMESVPVIVTERLFGETLRNRMEHQTVLELPEAARIIVAACSALARAHDRGVVHRDLKPENVFLVDEGAPRSTVKLLDFGLAKLRRGGGADLRGDDATTTQDAILGTHGYMAPEQLLRARDVDRRADVWALGVMLYEMLSGGRPIEGDSSRELMKRLLDDAIVPIEALVHDVPPQVGRLLSRMLHRSVDERLADVVQAQRVLEAFVS